MKWLIAAVASLLGALLIRASGHYQDDPLCQAVAATAWNPETVQAKEWKGYPGGWEDLPAGLFETEPLILYLPGMEQGYVIYRDAVGRDWIFPHWSFEFRTDQAGAHGGTHDICDVVVWSP